MIFVLLLLVFGFTFFCFCFVFFLSAVKISINILKSIHGLERLRRVLAGRENFEDKYKKTWVKLGVRGCMCGVQEHTNGLRE